MMAVSVVLIVSERLLVLAKPAQQRIGTTAPLVHALVDLAEGSRGEHLHV
jgi:hypothetical protein